MHYIECDEMTKLQKQLKEEQEQKNIMAQEMDIFRTRLVLECKDVEVLQPVSSSGTDNTKVPGTLACTYANEYVCIFN